MKVKNVLSKDFLHWLDIFLVYVNGNQKNSMAYPIIAWLSWVPNIIVAFVLVQRGKQQKTISIIKAG